MQKESYDFVFWKYLLNFTGLRWGFNSETWFLLPYSIVSVSYPILFRIYDKFRARYVVAVTFAIHFLTCTAISLYGEKYINDNIWIDLPVLLLHFQFSFSLGAMMRREDFIDKARAFVKKRNTGNWQIALVLTLVFLTICSVWNTVYYALYAAFFITCVALLPTENVLGRAIGYVGKHSMNIWMTHSFFCYHLFKDYTYSLEYPVLIFIAMMAASLLCSYVVNFVVAVLERAWALFARQG